ncbi:Prolyl-tRNA synthetase [Methanopyrus kandleri AV19]|uniref:Proline--tRNA ligase n=1 Tax=Methanopyrus kandleri (strain AV19 / DSM 6324 / JCM 9639 / NBRC 100938) TaxID=190192 RepID=SYP_METKA|nr:RecName: Full=Proline--tRNA ligase; AltName: Full=Prolyl-tRNA synthetase; Short=ProRS [Methanopyrus kandleri AV19]AAM02442.1 Prolyl-tRNA synthetase [Methanopyrus kandleri AV19]
MHAFLGNAQLPSTPRGDRLEFSEWYAEVLRSAEIMDVRYPVKGMYVWLPYGFEIRQRVVEKLRRKLRETGHEEVLFPTLIPETQLKKESEHIAGFEDEVYWVTHGGLKELDEKLALRPTSETAIYPMFALWIRSHADLPLKIFQIVNTFRYETKHTRPLIRMREITTFKEAHTAHATEEEAEEQVKEAVEIYSSFFDELGIPYIASVRPEWDKFPGAEYTVAFDTLMPDGRTLQIGTVHMLGQNFARTFEVTYETEEGDQEYVYMTCYGISDRVVASMIAIHGDERGLVLPPDVAPYQVVMVPILKKGVRRKILERAAEVEEMLREEGVRVKVDDRDMSPGRKFHYWELKGVPLRIELGARELEEGTAVVFRRDELERETYAFEELPDVVPELLEDIAMELRKRAREKFEKGIFRTDSPEEARRLVGEGIVETGWCGSERCGVRMEEEFGGDVLGTPYPEEDTEFERCPICGETAEYTVRIAKTY